MRLCRVQYQPKPQLVPPLLHDGLKLPLGERGRGGLKPRVWLTASVDLTDLASMGLKAFMRFTSAFDRILPKGTDTHSPKTHIRS